MSTTQPVQTLLLTSHTRLSGQSASSIQPTTQVSVSSQYWPMSQVSLAGVHGTHSPLSVSQIELLGSGHSWSLMHGGWPVSPSPSPSPVSPSPSPVSPSPSPVSPSPSPSPESPSPSPVSPSPSPSP